MPMHAARSEDLSQYRSRLSQRLENEVMYAWHLGCQCSCITSAGASSGPPATANSLLRVSAVFPLCRPSNSRRHHMGGSSGREPLCIGGYTSVKKYQMWPMTTPMISSLGTDPCITRLNPINTQGKYGAVKTSNPRKLNRVSGFRRDHMYTSVEDNGWPRKGIETSGDRRIRNAIE